MLHSWWTDARVEELKVRWTERETAAEICLAMGARSRNAVIGKARRLHLAERASANYTRPQKTNVGARLPRRRVFNHATGGKLMVVKPPALSPPFENPKEFIELGAGDCRWPGAGKFPQLLFCAAPQLNGYPYCAAHCAIAYVTPGARPREPRS